MEKEQQQEKQKPGTGSLLIFRTLPPRLPSQNTRNNPNLLRYFIANQLRALVRKQAGKDSTFVGCCTYARPSHAKKKDGEIYSTKQPGHVQIHHYANSSEILEAGEDASTRKHAYVGLQRCGSAMRCPACAARIRYVRRQEIETIAKAMVGKGYSILFQTLTAPHDFKSDPKVFMESFQEAVRYMKKSKNWALFAKKWGMKHYIRSIEVTDDAPWATRKSGIHFHSHTILFLERPFLSEFEAKKFRSELAKKWVAALKKVNLIQEKDEQKSFIHSVDIQRPKLAIQGETSDISLIENLLDYIAKGAAFEMSPAVEAKEGRKKDRLSHWQLMVEALAVVQKNENGEKDEKKQARLQARVMQIHRALKGLAHLYFSRDLKKMCGLEDTSDEKIIEGKEENQIYAFNTYEKKQQWKKIASFGNQKPLLVSLDASLSIPPEFLVDTAAGGVVDVVTGELLE